MSDTKLPVHGFVLAGGKSSRMGVDKALLQFLGRPMIEIAVEKLRGFCAEVSIAGNREDLRAFAPVVCETRVDAGPVAGIEAGLLAVSQPWAMFIPVDVPLVPMELLRKWAEQALAIEEDPEAQISGDLMGSSLHTVDRRQPAFCLLRHQVLPVITRELSRGERRIEAILPAIQAEFGVASAMTVGAANYSSKLNATALDLEFWFSNINTPQELAEAEIWAQHRTI